MSARSTDEADAAFLQGRATCTLVANAGGYVGGCAECGNPCELIAYADVCINCGIDGKVHYMVCSETCHQRIRDGKKANRRAFKAAATAAGKEPTNPKQIA